LIVPTYGIDYYKNGQEEETKKTKLFCRFNVI